MIPKGSPKMVELPVAGNVYWLITPDVVIRLIAPLGARGGVGLAKPLRADRDRLPRCAVAETGPLGRHATITIYGVGFLAA
jgi:hypothetical protein